MKRYKRTNILLALIAALALLLVSACGPIGGSGGSSLTVEQVLQNSLNAMKQLKTVHFDVKMTGNVQSNTAAATPTTGTPRPSSVTVNLAASGDEALPNQQSLHLTVGQSVTGQSANLAEIILQDKVYIQNTKGQWYVIDRSKLTGIANPFSGINIDQNTLLGLLQHSKITDHGDEMLNGQSLRHISAVLDKEGLKQLLESNAQLKQLFGQQNIDTVIDNAKTFQSSVDVWIDETKFYVHRTEMKLNLSADLTSLKNSVTPTATVTAAIPSSVTTSLDSIVDLSKFNEPVTIIAPANAIPTDNPITIFTGQ
jgi:hypothetical protein